MIGSPGKNAGTPIHGWAIAKLNYIKVLVIVEQAVANINERLLAFQNYFKLFQYSTG